MLEFLLLTFLSRKVAIKQLDNLHFLHHDRRAGFGLHGLSNFLCAGASEPEACGRERAELQEASAADALAS